MFIPLIFIQVILWVPSQCQNSTLSNQQIQLQLVHNEVEDFDNNGTIVKNWEYFEINNEKVLVSLTKSELELRCEAPFPIEWNITGHIGVPDFVQIQQYQREITRQNGNELEFVFKSWMFIFFAKENVTSASARIYCQHPENLKFSKSFAIFWRDEKPPFVNSGQALNVVDSKVIPCPTTDPKLAVNLIAENGSRVNPNDYVYDPLLGFQFLNEVEGQFYCVSLNDTVSVSASIIRSKTPGFDYFPKTTHIKTFTDEEMTLRCSRNGTGTSGGPNVDIVVDISMNHTVIKTTQIDNFTNSTIVIAKIGSMVKGNGTATCVDNDRRNIWTWGLEFVVPPKMVLNNYEGEVNCESDSEDRSVSTVRCRDPSHCEYMKHCFENPNLCNFNFRKQFYSNEPKTCLNHVNGEGYDCASVPYSHLNGIVACGAGGLVRHFTFFVSLEFLRRSSWEELSPSELIQMDDVQTILYTNNTSTFLCRAVAFLFADSLTFSIEFQNGTKQFMNNSDFNVTVFDGSSPRKVDEFNILAELNANLPLETVAIHCHAPWLNSAKFYSVEKRFETRYLLLPKILTKKAQSVVTFVIGRTTTQRLNCSAIGEPRPKYRWLKDGIPIENSRIAHQTQVTTGTNGESFLEFLEVDFTTSSDYLCVAENLVGNDSLNFRLNTIESDEFSIGTSDITYGSLIGTILFILVAVSIILGYVVSRYLKAKELIRGLTENEIDEFFKGRPELINSNQGLKAENLDLMPYDDKYEIDLDDVAFDSSQVLGSGEFSVVVKGRMISSNLDVAIKIAKSSADVSLFKTLLSEVKIMIFIEKHENIVSLIGVCTRNIRTRNIHIVLEMCANGSLETYLRKGRKRFINLIDQNQKLNLQVLTSRPDAEDRLSTVDLIKWAAQIAKGMEYLSFKGIVHADLAARNVLLNADKTAKISDFGLSKKLYECTNYVKKTKSPLPWRWMALETLTTLTFSKESDVWAYGATIWEIFSLGDIPFPNETWDKEFLARLACGMRMGKPKFATLDIYSQMVNCWDSDILCRPEFPSFRKYFSDLLEQISHGRIQDELGSGTHLTFLSETGSIIDDNGSEYYSNNANFYENMSPSGISGMPQYANIDPSVGTGTALLYANVP